MNRLRDFKKREVVAVDQGLTLGRPEKLIVDIAAHRVGVVVLHEGAANEMSTIIRAGDVHSFGADTLAIDSVDLVDLAYRDPRSLELITRGGDLRRKDVMTSGGDRLGRITEVEVDDAGVVTAYLIRRGFLGWFRPKLNVHPRHLQTGEDVFVVSEPAPASIERQE